MNAVAFDTLAYAKRLRDAGIDAQHAEAQAEALSLAIGDSLATSDELKAVETTITSELKSTEAHLRSELKVAETAVRTELKVVETALRTELKDAETALRTELKATEASLRAEIEKLGLELRKDIREAQISTIKWLVPLLFGQTAVLAAVVKLL